MTRPVAGPRSRHTATGLPQFAAITVADLAVAGWYRHTFDLVTGEVFTASDGSRVAIARGASLLLELKQREQHVARREGADGFFKIGWFVESLEAEVARLATKGVAPVTDIIAQPQFLIRFVLVADPEGNLIQLFEETEGIDPTAGSAASDAAEIGRREDREHPDRISADDRRTGASDRFGPAD